jgi:outer membrane protein
MKKSVLIFVLVLLTGYGYAKEIKKITLQEAFTLAEQNSKLLQLDSLKIQALDIKKTQSQNAMLPVLGLNSSYTRLSNNIDPFQIPFSGEVFTLNPQILNQFGNRVSIQQPIFQGLKNWNTMKSLDQLKTASALDKQKDQQDIKLNVIQQYYNLYKLQQTLIVLDSNIAQTQVRVNDVSKFKEAGLALNNDVMRAELQKTNLLVTKADIESMVKIYNFNMCVLLGLDFNTKIEVENPETVENASTTIQSYHHYFICRQS